GRRGHDHGVPRRAGVGLSHALERAGSLARDSPATGDRRATAARRPHDRPRSRPPTGRGARAVRSLGAGRHARRRQAGQDAARARSVVPLGAHRGSVHDDSRAGGDAGEPGRTTALREGGCARDRRLLPRDGAVITTHHAPRTLLLLALLATPAVAQVDPSGAWRTLHTEHFRIHFRPSLRPRAVVAAAEAERAYRLLARELHPPRGIIDPTLSDDVDTPNGFTTV